MRTARTIGATRRTFGFCALCGGPKHPDFESMHTTGQCRFPMPAMYRYCAFGGQPYRHPKRLTFLGHLCEGHLDPSVTDPDACRNPPPLMFAPLPPKPSEPAPHEVPLDQCAVSW